MEDVAAPPPEQGVQGALAELWEHQRAEALARVAVLEDAVAAIVVGQLTDDERKDALTAAHKLHGSAGIYGFHRASELAAQLEDLLASEGAVPAGSTPQLASTVLALRTQLEGESRSPDAGWGQPGRALDLLVVGEDVNLGERLIAAAAGRRLRAELVGFDEVRERVARDPPSIVLADPAGGDVHALDLLGELTVGDRAVPLLVLTGSDQLIDRVEVARHGADGFLERSLHPDLLIDAAERFVAGLRQPPATVLAVDDDPSLLAAVEALLGARGYRVETVEDAQRFWARLPEVTPDIAILDLDMPQVDGIELCKALRLDPRWSSLPVLILTAYRDPEVITRSFAAGADDYVPKPIVAEELAGRVRNRLERVRAYREAWGQDEVTGVMTRPAVLRELERITRHALEAGEPLSLVLIDVDDLRGVNEAHGLAAGDALLERVGEALRAELGVEALGRWDGDQFIAGLNGMTTADAVRWVGEVVDRLNGAGLGASVSGGVAGAAGDAIDPVELVSAAERALAAARRSGGARLVAAGSDEEVEGERVDVAIVEDDPAVAEVLRLALETLGVSSRRFADGAEASAALAGDPPALTARVVLLDWDLPGLDGLSILRRMAERGVLDDTRVIMVTVRAGEEEMLKALELGAADFVPKPFSVPVLVERIRRALEP